jgi:hypothetical protein
MDAPPDRAKLPAVNLSRPGSMMEALKRRANDFLVAGIFLLTTDSDEQNMNLEELRSKSSAELRDIYNGLVDKQIKRFADRVEAERRTAVILQESNQWTGPLPSNKKGEAGAKAEPAGSKLREKIAAKKTAASGAGKTVKAKPEPKGKAKPAPKEEKPKKAAAAPAPKVKKEPKPRGVGAPRTNASYIAVETDKKMHSESARTKVYNFFREQGKKGADREAAEQAFVDDENISVKSAIDYLVKMGMLAVKED